MAINMTFVDFVTPVPADWLNNVNTFVNNPAIQTYVAPFTGAVSRTTTSKFSDVVSVLDFGADKTGVADSTTAFQAAFNTGKLVYAPGGTYKLSSNITTQGAGLFGDGQASTFITTTDTSTNDIIKWNGLGSLTPQGSAIGPLFHSFTLSAGVNAGKTSGALINIAPSVGEVSYAQVHDITFIGGYDQLGTVAASHMKVFNNNFLNYFNSGHTIQNTNNPDSGDSAVYANLFNVGFTGSSSQAGILHYNSAGTKIFGNKFLGGRFGYFMNAQIAGAGLGGVYIVANSMEAMVASDIQLNRQSVSGGWGGVVIANNEFGGSPNTIVCNGANFLSNVSVTDNVFTQMPAGAQGVTLDNQFDWSISGNKFEGSSTGTTGIATGAGVTSLHIGINSYTQMATPVILGAPTQTTIDLTPQSVNSAAVTSTAYGSLFSGTVAVAWPKAFAAVPVNVIGTVTTTGSGGISVLITNVTTTGCNVTVVGVSNGGNVSFTVTALGIA